jgi:hypothetical protein
MFLLFLLLALLILSLLSKTADFFHSVYVLSSPHTRHQGNLNLQRWRHCQPNTLCIVTQHDGTILKYFSYRNVITTNCELYDLLLRAKLTRQKHKKKTQTLFSSCYKVYGVSLCLLYMDAFIRHRKKKAIK